MFKKLFTAAWMALLFTFCQLASAATNVSATATPSSPTAPATVTLAASGDSDGNPIMVTKVEYFNGTTSLGVSVQSPFTLTLNNLAAGTYQISVKVTTTDPANPVLQSAPLALTVGTAPGAATAYFIHTDQLNTPRAITDGSGNLVWQWDSDPFGKDAPNELPAGQPAFTFNQRFPGQQFDRESNLHYNYFRDYDPALGRYVQSDPIGLKGGINTYGYVNGNPIVAIDFYGLERFVFESPEFGSLDNFRSIPEQANTIDIIAHANWHHITEDNKEMSFSRLVKIIKGVPDYKKKRIRMLACSTGASDYNGIPVSSVGKRLHEALGIPVEAPNKSIWAKKDGTYSIYGHKGGEVHGPLDPNNPGRMVNFE